MPITVSWLAGFIDGDGCFGLYLLPRQYTVKLIIVQRNIKVLKNIVELFPVFQGPYTLGDAWQIIASKRIELKALLKLLIPNLVIKQEQAKLAFKALELLTSGKRFCRANPLSAKLKEKLKIISLKMKKVKKDLKET